MSDTELGNAEISRRRVVQGALWAAPVVAIATAVPAAATASDAPGVAQFASGAALQVVTSPTPRKYIFTGLQLQHLGGAVIENLRVTIVSDTNLASPPVVTGAGWSFVPAASSQTTFVFAYGSAVSSGATSALGVELTRTNPAASAVVFTVTASGDTNGVPGSVTATVSV